MVLSSKMYLVYFYGSFDQLRTCHSIVYNWSYVTWIVASIYNTALVVPLMSTFDSVFLTDSVGYLIVLVRVITLS